MENRVITIARSYGSGGRKMGKLLAKDDECRRFLEKITEEIIEWIITPFLKHK